jgi:hypothetical protein
MTISSETNKNSYTCNGVTATFPYTFRVLDQGDLKVQIRTTSTGVLTTLVLTTDYTVTGVGASGGGNVVLVDAAGDAPTGTTLIITTDMDETQETDYTEYDTFPATTHEDALDKLTIIAHQQTEKLDRSIKFDPGVSGIGAEILGTPDAGDVPLVNSTADGIYWAAIADIDAYSFGAGTGLLVQTAANTAIVRTLTGTANEITVTNGSGVSANPTVSLPTAMTMTGKTLTGGTYSGIALTGTINCSSATLTAPVVTSLNGMTITTSTGTFTLTNGKTLSVSNSLTLAGADGKTLTLSNTLTFTGTDSSTVAFGAGGTVAYTANKLSAFAATTSAELAGVISDETGSGALVFGTSPRITTSLLDTNGKTWQTVEAAADAVNYLRMYNSASGVSPSITSGGSGTNLDLNLSGKGTGGVNLLGRTDAAAISAGNVGEHLTANNVGSGVNLTTAGTVQNITSLSLTAGVWLVHGNVRIAAGASGAAQSTFVGLSLTSATMPTNDCTCYADGQTAVTANVIAAGHMQPLLVNVSSTTTVYMCGVNSFANTSKVCIGQIDAYRM